MRARATFTSPVPPSPSSPSPPFPSALWLAASSQPAASLPLLGQWCLQKSWEQQWQPQSMTVLRSGLGLELEQLYKQVQEENQMGPKPKEQNKTGLPHAPGLGFIILKEKGTSTTVCVLTASLPSDYL